MSVSQIGELTLAELEPTAMDCIDTGISLEVLSPPGRGKSEFFEDLVKKLSKRDGFEWGYAPMFLATQTPPDLIGYQFKGERPWGKDGTSITITDPSLPLWMMTEDQKPLWAFKRGLVVLEEYGQGEADVKRASAQLLLKGQIGPWRIPNFGKGGWGVVACSNRFGVDRSGVTKSFDFVINRRMEVHLKDDAPTWENWALHKNIDPLIVSFAMQHPTIVWTRDVPEKQGPWCTPRSLIMAAEFLKTRAKRNGGHTPDDPQTMISVAGLIGQGAMSMLFTHIKLERELPSMQKVIDDPTGTEVPKAADLRMLLVYSFGHKVNKSQIGPILTYIQRLGKEFTMAFLRTAIIRDSEMLRTPAVTAWCKNNTQLVVQISQAIK